MTAGEHVDENDICSLHDYALFEDNLDKYDDPGYYTEKNVEHRAPNASGNRYHGEPVMVTEYGGVAFPVMSREPGAIMRRQGARKNF